MNNIRNNIQTVVLVALVAANAWGVGDTPVDEVVLLETDRGALVIALDEQAAPRHAANFKMLVRDGFYDGIRFHRVAPNTLIQAGCPNTKSDNRFEWGRGGSEDTVPAEFNDRMHVRGSVAMARMDDPDSARSQFFISLKAMPSWDGNYTNFGDVIQGIEVAEEISRLPRMAVGEIPIRPTVITKARVLPREEALKLAEPKGEHEDE